MSTTPYPCQNCGGTDIRDMQNSATREYWESCDTCGSVSSPSDSAQGARHNWQSENLPGGTGETSQTESVEYKELGSDDQGVMEHHCIRLKR